MWAINAVGGSDRSFFLLANSLETLFAGNCSRIRGSVWSRNNNSDGAEYVSSRSGLLSAFKRGGARFGTDTAGHLGGRIPSPAHGDLKYVSTEFHERECDC